jgi:hypothetical protein
LGIGLTWLLFSGNSHGDNKGPNHAQLLLAS